MTVRRVAELASLSVGLILWSYAGWDGAMWDARWQVFLHLAALAALGGLVAVARVGDGFPRTRIDVPIMGLLLAFAIACLSAWNAGLSARALGAVVATAGMLPISLVALRYRPGWTAVTVVLPIAALAAMGLAVLVAHRVEWILAGGPGLPPIRLAREGTVFGSVAVAPFVVLGAMPIALLVPHVRLRRALLVTLVAIGLPLLVISGSRSAWLAVGMAAAVLGTPLLRTRGGAFLARWRWTARNAWLVALGVVAGTLALAFVAPRLTDLGSLVYRGFLWRDTLAAVSGDPLFGIGPGSMPWARQAAAPALSFPVRQPHSHDLPLGIFGDAGLVGVLAGLLVFTMFVLFAGPWRSRSLRGRAAFAVLAGFAVGMLFEDLTFLPNFNLLVILLAAIALADAGAVIWKPMRVRLPALAAGVAGVALAAVMVVGDAAAVAYRIAMDAAGEARWPAAVAWLERSVALDGWHPAGPKALAVAADRDGRPDLARLAAERAVVLNPGDGQSWTNLAVLCRQAEDAACAARAADSAVAAAAAQGRELANAAITYEWLGDHARADRAYGLSLLTNYWTSLALPWPRAVPVGEGTAEELPAPTAELNLLIARRIGGEPVLPATYEVPTVRALAAAMVGDRSGAQAAIEEAQRRFPESATTWEFAALLTDHYGGDSERERRLAGVTRGVPLPSGGSTERAFLIFDIAAFRAYPGDGLVSDAEPLLPDPIWPWILEPLLAPPA